MIHAILTGIISMALMNFLHVRLGFTFSAGAFDYIISYRLGTNGWMLIPVGLVYALIYYFLFSFAIRKFNLATPVREAMATGEQRFPRFFHCACGDVFRSLDTRTKIGQAFLYYSSRGELVPDEVSIDLWKESIEGAVETHRFKPELDALVLDGIPRSVHQARLMELLIEVVKVFHFLFRSFPVGRAAQEARDQR